MNIDTDSGHFNEAYFARYYFDRATSVADHGYFDRLADFVGAYLRLLDCDVSRILDAGCGPGFIHDGLRRIFPDASIDAFDVSEYICERFGWECSSIEAYAPRQAYDLVICQDVVQYLDRDPAARVLEKLGACTRHALFFGVLTVEDWEHNCDQTLTDGDVHLRSAAWYRRHLKHDFKNAGGGIFVKRDADMVLYALEALQ